MTRRPPGGRRYLLHLVPPALLVLLLGLLAGRYVATRAPEPLHDPDAVPRVVDARGDLAADEAATIALFEAASPSVVHVTASRLAQDHYTTNLFEIPRGTGSGFIWDTQGYVVTNFHVTAGADRFTVTLSDQSRHSARLAGVDPDHDLAVLKADIPQEKCCVVPLGTSRDLRVGQKVFAIGNPFGLDQTLTTGIISGTGREIRSPADRPILDVIQTDAAINPGNSGGPLLDSAGRLIGINTAIVSPSGAYSGVGFAVPVDTVNRIVPQLVRHGRVVRPGLGVMILDPRVAARAEIDGVVVSHVVPGSGAEEAGLRPLRRGSAGVELGDVIRAVDGAPVADLDDIYRALDGRSVGDTVPVEVEREGERRTLAVRLSPLQ